MVVLSGERVSDLERLPSCRPGDEFLVSRHYNLSSDRLFSRRIEYKSIIDDAVENLCSMLHLSSAAFVERADYSRKGHGHDYSSVYVYARPLSAISAASGVEVHPDKAEPIAGLSAENGGKVKSVVMYSPGQQYKSIDDVPFIGELKFLARKQLWIADVGAADFDGWVYPDGSEYRRSDFPSAYAIYGDGQSDTFKVPFLSNFIKLNPGVDRADPMKKVPAANEAIAAHTHGLPRQVESGQRGKVIVDVKVPAAVECSQEAYKDEIELLETIHLGSGNEGTIESSEYKIENVRQSDLTVSGGKCSTEEIDAETVPNHNLLPVMIYIGKKNEPHGQ